MGQDFLNLSIVSLFSQEVDAVFPYGEMAAAEGDFWVFCAENIAFLPGLWYADYVIKRGQRSALFCRCNGRPAAPSSGK